MRIAILADFPLSALTGGAVGRGGGQGCTWLPQLALAFQEFPEFDIHWVVLDRKTRRQEVIKAHGQTFHVVPGVKFSLELLLHEWPARMAIRKVLRTIRPDVVHAWGTELIYPAALQDCRCPTVLSMQGVLTEYQRIGGLPDDWRWRRMVATEPRFIRSATIVTSESQWGIDRVKEVHSGADCRMVEYGVHPSFYDLTWQPDPETPYAIFVGGADKRKGVDILIDALKLLPDRRWEMRFAGDPAIQRACDAAGLENIRCLGLLPWKEMQKQLQRAWCFTLPTRGDTSPNSVKEARVIGLPVVTTVHGGQAGYIINGINGWVINPLGPATLARALADVMSKIENARGLGEGQHKEDRAYLHPSRTAEGFACVYRELAA